MEGEPLKDTESRSWRNFWNDEGSNLYFRNEQRPEKSFVFVISGGMYDTISGGRWVIIYKNLVNDSLISVSSNWQFTRKSQLDTLVGSKVGKLSRNLGVTLDDMTGTAVVEAKGGGERGWRKGVAKEGDIIL